MKEDNSIVYLIAGPNDVHFRANGQGNRHGFDDDIVQREIDAFSFVFVPKAHQWIDPTTNGAVGVSYPHLLSS